MTNYERIIEAMSLTEYAQMRVRMQSCPIVRSQDDCLKRLNSCVRSSACFMCWVDYLEEEFVE